MQLNNKKKTVKSKRRFSNVLTFMADNIVHIVVLAVSLLIIGGFIYIACKNECNRISEGIVVDKHHRAAYSTTEYKSQGDLKLPVTKYHPATYHFTIEGDKNGKSVKYYFAVTEMEYYTYKIGDYYKK